MTCPDLTALAKVATGSADLAVLRHLESCETCRQDLEILKVAPSAVYPDAEVPAYLNARVMRSIAEKESRARRKAGPLDLTVSGIIVAAGACFTYVATSGGITPVVPYAVTYSAICGALAAWYHKRQADREMMGAGVVG